MSLDVFPPSRMEEIQSANERTALLDKEKSRINNELGGSKPIDGLERTNNATWPIYFIILTIMLERAAYYGILSNLALFLSDDLELSQVVTVVSVFMFTGMAWLMCTVGGVVGDSYTGRFKAILGSFIIYIIGALLLELSARFCDKDAKVTICKKLSQKGAFILCTLFIISIGEGAFKSNITAFGAEQITRQDDKTYRMYFNWFYWGINIGCFIGYSFLAFTQQYCGFVIGYYPPVACLVLACILFLIPKSRYNVYPLSANAFKKVYNVIKEAKSRGRSNAERVGCPGLEEVMPMRSWLDRAMIKYGGSYLDSEVEEVKKLGKIGIMFIILVPYWMIYFQMNSTFLLQGLHMNLHSNDISNQSCQDKDKAIIPAASLSLADVVVVLLAIPLMDKIVYPWLDRRGWGITLSKRILIGFLFATASMVAAGVVEHFRRGLLDKQKLTQCININHNYPAVDMSIFYQVPQYALIGVSEVFASVGSLEFAYQEAPQSMHGFVMGLLYLVQSVASLLGAGLYAFSSTKVLKWVDNKGNARSANLGKLDNYFYLLAAIMFVTWLIFVVLSVKIDFKYRNESLAAVRTKRRSSNKRGDSLSKM
ncbi:solute carrier family 15 member 4-like [Actinia tenebrosa]|uniref:Solute carrier family 15 member 4-like n=1 Tax=Actinia tenebrosa TaxID=6105 RepID=A0A6P8H7S2_ACTTE|nr:solute carrier family 15 member 4-like [Actinia tenebrosa]